jgi:putative MATE family efflux protein
MHGKMKGDGNLKDTKELGEEKVFKLLLKYSIPAIVGMLVNALYNVIDRVFVGNGVNSLAIAGTTIAFPIMLMIMGFAMLIGIGANSLVAIKLGQQKKAEAEHIMGNALILLIIISLVISAIGLIFLTPILKAFGASDTVLPYARDFLSIILWGTVFQSVGFGMNNFIRSSGSPMTAMMTMIIGAVINVILNPLFIFVFNWGIKGSAAATVISQAVSAVWVLYYFTTKKSSLKLYKKNFKLNMKTTTSIMAIGSAPFLMQISSSVQNVILNKSLESYGGDIAVTSMGVVMAIMNLMLMPIFGINQGVQPIIGYNYGAKKYDRVKEALKLAIITATIFVAIGFITIRLFPEQYVGMFNRKDTELVAFGSHALLMFTTFLPLIGFQIVSANYFQAVGKPKQAAILSLSRQILILIPALLILPKFFGIEGVFSAGPLADILSSLMTGAWLFFELRHLDNKHSETLEIKEA